jgi:ABC-type transporter MlaC component
MKMKITMMILVTIIFSWFAGCASAPQKTDDSHIKRHAEDSFKELQKEENKY